MKAISENWKDSLKMTKYISGKAESVIVDDGSIKYKIDFEKGHKTGFYFDQSENRFFIEKICNGEKCR